MGEGVKAKTEQKSKRMLQRSEGELCKTGIHYSACNRLPTSMDQNGLKVTGLVRECCYRHSTSQV